MKFLKKKKQMTKLENAVLLYLKGSASGNLWSTEFINMLNSLSKRDQITFMERADEIDRIYWKLNSSFSIEKDVNTIYDYNKKITSVDEMILRFCSLNKIELKNKPSKKMIHALKYMFGYNFCREFMYEIGHKL